MPEIVGDAIAHMPHLHARREAPGQPGGQIGPRRPDRSQRNREAGGDELGLRRIGEVSGEREPVQEPHLRRDLDPFPVTAAARLRRSLVTDEDELAAEIEEPVGRGEFGPRQDLTLARRTRSRSRSGAHRAWGWQSRPGRRCCGSPSRSSRRTPSAPRPEDQVGLHVRPGLGRGARRALFRGVDTFLDVEREDVSPGPGDEAHLRVRGEVEFTNGDTDCSTISTSCTRLS